MAGVRKTGGAGRVRKTRLKQVDEQQKVEQQRLKPEEAIKELRNDLAQATAPGVGRSDWLSKDEVKGLMEKAKAAGPEAEAALKGDLAEALKTGQLNGQELKVGKEALEELSAFTGVAAGTFRTAVQNKDAVADHELGEGLAKHKEEVSTTDAVATKNQIDQLQIEGKTGASVSKAEFTPHYKAGQVVADELKQAARAHLEDNHPEKMAAIDAVSPAINRMVSKTAGRLTKDPAAMERVANAVGLVGKQGFQDAVTKAGPDVAKAFTEATGIRAVNPAVVGPMLDKVPKLAEKVAPSLAPKLADTCATLGTKLGTTVAKEGAETAAKAGAKGAAAGSKAVPGLGNVVSAGCACLAAVGLVKALKKSPRDGEGIAKAGLNTLLQTVGVAFPIVGLAGDLIDMGWSAKKAMTDQKKGVAPDEGVSKQDASALLGEPAKLLSSALAGAGYGDAGKAFEGLADATAAAADKDVVERHQVDAFSQFSKVASQEVGKAAAQENDPETRDALNTVSHGFGELFKVLYQHKKLKGADGQKRGDIQGQLARITGDVAMGLAALRIGGKDASLDVVDQQLEQNRLQDDQQQAADAQNAANA